MNTSSNPFSLLKRKSFLWVLLFNTLWINASEIFRYFQFVMPMMQSTFSEIETITPINPSIFSLWMLWDSILVISLSGFIWIFLERFGTSIKYTVIATLFFWLTSFGLLWLGLYCMGLATLSIISIALPLSLFEMLIGAFITRWGLIKSL